MSFLIKSFNFIKYILSAIIVMLALSHICAAADIISGNYDVYNAVTALEKQVYNREYSQDNFYIRLSRLEKSMLGSVYTDSIYNRIKRLQNVLDTSKMLKQKLNRQIILELLEKRYFGFTYKEDSVEARVARLEECIYGKVTIGNIDYKFENLAKQIPAVNQQNIVHMQTANYPENMKDFKEYTSFSDIGLNDSGLDYFRDIKKMYGNRILKWNSFPILVYIYPESDKYFQIAQKSVQIWSEYIQVRIVDNVADANIIINWKKNYTDITKLDHSSDYEHLLYSKDDKIRVNIYCGRYKDTSYLDRFLVHQMGHALGIWGHSKDKTDIMYPFKEFKNDINYKDINSEDNDISVTSSPYRPSPKDINTLIRVYR